jgi:hypothetical protein
MRGSLWRFGILPLEYCQIETDTTCRDAGQEHKKDHAGKSILFLGGKAIIIAVIAILSAVDNNAREQQDRNNGQSRYWLLG